MIAKDCNRIVETLNLIARQRLARRVVGSSEVSHHAVDTHVTKLLQRRDEFT